MWDRHDKRIHEGDYLRDVRFAQGFFFRVREVVYNTVLKGVAVHERERGGWVGAYPHTVQCTAVWEIVAADLVPVPARELIERAL